MAMNQTYGNSPFGPNGANMGANMGPQYMGMNPQRAQAPNPVNIPSTLTAEEYAKLNKNQNTFSLAVTETQRLRAICNHRSQDGTRDVLVETPDGKLRCPICNYEFIPVDSSMTRIEDIQETIYKTIDILQTIKLMYLNMPVEVAREYFIIIALIEKIPELFEYACKDYAQHENYNPYQNQNRNMSVISIFNALFGNGNGSGWAGQPMAQGPWTVDPNGVVASGGNPAFNGFNGADPMPMPQYYPYPNPTNGFVYDNPQYGYQAQTGGYSYVPGSNTNAPQQAAPQQVDVNSPAFKAAYDAALKAMNGNQETVKVSETVKA